MKLFFLFTFNIERKFFLKKKKKLIIFYLLKLKSDAKISLQRLYIIHFIFNKNKND
jgi:hypothetical protein